MTDQRRKRPRDPAQLAKFIVDIATGEVPKDVGNLFTFCLSVRGFVGPAVGETLEGRVESLELPVLTLD